MVTKKKKTKKSKARSINDQWIEGIAVSTNECQSYSINQKYEVGQIIDHVSFGRGVVKANLDNKKIEVVFEEEIKTLVHDI
jgi:hypothetical protein